jgi:ubiquinone/menaquinone biosynthesis C-methylase UbiE
MEENAAKFHTQQDDVFGRLVSRYDFLGDLFSLGIHRIRKRKFAQIFAKESWRQLLDCPAGNPYPA